MQASGALVAIKSVNLAKLNKKLKDNLYSEIEILKGLHHPHIVALIDCRESPTHIHLVMEYCELGDLSYFIKKRDKLTDHPATRDMVRKYPMPSAGGLNEVVVRHFLKQLASAMEFLRDRNFIHRDVKPQNLLLLPSPQFLAKFNDQPPAMAANRGPIVPMVGLPSLPMLKIADFGFARSLPSTSLAETLCGSPLYMAPEILRYEKYDAKADLWSVGTVLFEMITGRPPFRATNHVELLRKIEQQQDQIKFPKDAIVSPGLKEIIRALLKRTPVERIPFEDFFGHSLVVDPIPGLVDDDRPDEIRPPSKSKDVPMSRRTSTRDERRRSKLAEEVLVSDAVLPSSPPRERPIASSPRTQVAEAMRQAAGTSPRAAAQDPPKSRGHRRPSMVSAATAPNVDTLRDIRTIRAAPVSSRNRPRGTSLSEGQSHKRPEDLENSQAIAEAEQAVRDAREYVLVEKRAVEINAFADELAAGPRIGTGTKAPARGGQIMRRATTQGNPSSLTGAVSSSPSRAMQIAQGKPRTDNVPQRQNSYGKSYGSPSTTSAIAKALHGASVRLLGVGWSPQLIGKGLSPPQFYSPFPTYPTPQGTVGLLGDGRPTAPIDEDQRAVNVIEESATRSDVVFGFAEVKYKQLIPITPSMDNHLAGLAPDTSGESVKDDGGLTIEAVVVLSEEALVLYVKALSLLAKSMDIAGTWWSRRNRNDNHAGHPARSDSPGSGAAGNRINNAVQWVRTRFNEVIEKAELVRLKLVDAQKQLPEDHPGHPNNHADVSRVSGSSTSDGIVLSTGITAEKLMYDRALEMSRNAAINEIANDDLPGCEISYTTAIRMLEAVLETEEEIVSQRKRASSLREDREPKQEIEGEINGINLNDRNAVLKGNVYVYLQWLRLTRSSHLYDSIPPQYPAKKVGLSRQASTRLSKTVQPIT